MAIYFRAFGFGKPESIFVTILAWDPHQIFEQVLKKSYLAVGEKLRRTRAMTRPFLSPFEMFRGAEWQNAR